MREGKKLKKRVYALYRVSTLGQVEKDDIPMQKQRCHEFANMNGWEIIGEFSEKGVSGFKVSAKDRDAIQEIQRDATLGKFDILLVFMFDRLGRRDDETPFIVEWFVKNGIEVWSTEEGQQRFDNHVDKLMNYLRYWQASGESIKTSIRTKTQLGQIVQEGKFRGGACPYGYSLIKRGRTGKKGRELYEIERNPEEAIVVAKMFEMSSEQGFGARLISSELDSMGIKERNGNPFHYSSIQKMLRNVLYTGVLRSGETYSEIFDELKIVEQDIFDRVQTLMDQRTQHYQEKRNSPQRVGGQALLSGNIYCGHCGGHMFASTARKSHHAVPEGAINERIPIYKCYNRTKGKGVRCTAPSTYRAQRIDDAIREMLLSVFDRAKDFTEKDLVDHRVSKSILEYEMILKKTRADYKSKTQELARLDEQIVDAIAGTGAFTPQQLRRRMDTVQEQVNTLADRINDMTDRLEQTGELTTQIKREYNNLQKWADVFRTAPLDTQKMIAAEMVEYVKVSAGYELDVKLSITYDQFMGGL